jgi:hypothetical protein
MADERDDMAAPARIGGAIRYPQVADQIAAASDRVNVQAAAGAFSISTVQPVRRKIVGLAGDHKPDFDSRQALPTRAPALHQPRRNVSATALGPRRQVASSIVALNVGNGLCAATDGYRWHHRDRRRAADCCLQSPPIPIANALYEMPRH